MNDRYLYRAKRKNLRELPKEMWWVQGYLYGIWERRYILWGMTNDVPDMIEIDPSTICQCTGKHDIPENKMIYEHDFVSFLDTYSTENGYAEQYCVGEVLWDDEELCFYVTNRLSAESYEVLDDCKVIGNRFDNPELLEVGE